MLNLRYSAFVIKHVSSNKMAFIFALHNRYHIHRAPAVYNCWVIVSRLWFKFSPWQTLYTVGLIGENMFTLLCLLHTCKYIFKIICSLVLYNIIKLHIVH